jgi:hypothetical protein
MKSPKSVDVCGAASLLGKRSAEVREKKWGRAEFLRRMRSYGKAGGRPRKIKTKRKGDAK